ncbi:MAG: bifunctional 2-C-methyl-D-erythritol 4-phosphate cytidylyltransferase/2-C-methyl-D-erythritol 2,4-cyclodiphosphate synthase, partial [Hyphomicrobiales bacterium]
LKGLDVLDPVSGGATRQASVMAGIDALKTFKPDCVLIHDAARPFASEKLISRVIDGLNDSAGVLPVQPVTDTIKKVGGAYVESTLDRSILRAAQTPQGFRFADILKAHEQAAAETSTEFTDDSSIAEWAGIDVAIVDGEAQNTKLTTDDDIQAAERAMTKNLSTLTDIRTGNGYDVHAFEPGDAVILCGVPVKHDKQLKGHSDADVGMHALTDAILGSLAEGDIGKHFPPSDPNWKGAASHIFLEHAVKLVRDRGGDLGHCDLTLVCEHPKIGPHVDAMRTRLSEIMQLAPDRISVKATTSERLGFTGRGEGIAALATATIRLPEG